MIQPQELRIGNYLYYKVFPHAPESYKIIEVRSISKNGFISFINDDGKEETYYLDNFEKIAITEEILLKSGFENLIMNKFEIDNMSLYKCDDIFQFFVEDEFSNNTIDIIISFLHQLQNFFYELKGIELKFEDIS